MGGLGFKRAMDVNNALLAKLAWMMASKRDSLCISILRAKYKVEHNWLHKDPPIAVSPIWKAIETAKKIVAKGTCYLIGDGSNINVWIDPWVPWLQDFILKPSQASFADTPLMVSMLLDTSTHCWKENLINH